MHFSFVGYCCCFCCVERQQSTENESKKPNGNENVCWEHNASILLLNIHIHVSHHGYCDRFINCAPLCAYRMVYGILHFKSTTINIHMESNKMADWTLSVWVSIINRPTVFYSEHCCCFTLFFSLFVHVYTIKH